MRRLRLKWLLVIILINLLFFKPRVVDVNKFDVDVKKDETLINFIFNDEVNALYIQNNDVDTLVMLDYENNKNSIEKHLKENGVTDIDELYTITPVMLNLFGIESEYYKTENNLIMLNFYNNNFCIYIEEYQSVPDLNICKFLYMVKFKTGILKDLIGDPEVIFQNVNNPLPIKTQELIYDNWTELYTISNSEYTVLKVSKEGFDTLIIPK